MFGHQRLLKAFACSSLLVACAQNVEDVDSSESALLPNGTVFDTGHDGTTYRLIAEHFAARGLDMHVDTSAFAPGWPLADTKTTVLNRLGTPILYSSFGYYNTGVDVMRTDSTVGSDVLAPHDGIAVVFDWSGNRITEVTSPYATIVAVYDPSSHVVTQLMHVAALSTIAASADPVQVTKGTVIGKLAPAPLSSGADSLRLANTQVVFVDGENKKLLNPAAFLPYHDAIAPEARSLYATDESSQARSELTTGHLDLVVEAFDRDDDSNRNLEVSAIAFTVKDQNGTVLASQPRCSLDEIYDSIAAPTTFRAKDFIDFGSAASQMSGGWPNSDVDNPQRTFRYGLTQLGVVNGRCTVLDDAAGFLDITDAVTKVDVSVTLWDAKGNTSEKTMELLRAAAPPPPPPPPVDTDGGI
jgi:hypothetical protein